MNAVESLVCTGVFPTLLAHSVTVLTAVSSVRIVRTTSTSFISGTGLKKCTPSTWPGRLVAAAIAVTFHELVIGLDEEHVVAGLRRHLHDPRAHEPAADHTDVLDGHESFPVVRVSAGGRGRARAGRGAALLRTTAGQHDRLEMR